LVARERKGIELYRKPLAIVADRHISLEEFARGKIPVKKCILQRSRKCCAAGAMLNPNRVNG
jgi:hypothetical protein